VAGPTLRGDEGELLSLHHATCSGLAAFDVGGRPQSIEDACAFARVELLARRPERTNPVGGLRIVARGERVELAL
jgi:hypothetical protein